MKCAFSLVSSPAKIEKKSRRQVGERNEGWSVDEWIAHLAPPSVGRGIVTAGGRGQVASVTRARRSKRKYRYGSGMEASRFIVRFVLHRRRIWLILLNRFITYLRIREFLYIIYYRKLNFLKRKENLISRILLSRTIFDWKESLLSLLSARSGPRCRLDITVSPPSPFSRKNDSPFFQCIQNKLYRSATRRLDPPLFWSKNASRVFLGRSRWHRPGRRSMAKC